MIFSIGRIKFSISLPGRQYFGVEALWFWRGKKHYCRIAIPPPAGWSWWRHSSG